MQSDVPQFPSVKLKQLHQRKGRLDGYIEEGDLWHESVTVATVEQLTNMVLWTFGPSSEARRTAVFSSLTELIGTVLEPDKTRLLFLRLLSSEPLLTAGGSVTGGVHQVEEAWHCIHIQTIVRSSKGLTLWVKVAYGPSAGVVFKQFVPYSDALLARMFRACRFPAIWGGYWEHLGQMYLWGFLKYRYGSLICTRVASDDKVRTFNRAVIKARMQPCPRQLHRPCIQCHVGFDQCVAGTHPKTQETSDDSNENPQRGNSSPGSERSSGLDGPQA